MAGYKDTSGEAKKLLKLHRKKSNHRPMVSFIHNGSNITTWMGISLKPQSRKSTAPFLRQQKLFRISSCRSLDQHKETGVVRQLPKTAIFIATPMEKRYLAIHFTKVCFSVKLLTEKLWIYCQSTITCLLEIQARFLFFSLSKIKMIKQHRFYFL